MDGLCLLLCWSLAFYCGPVVLSVCLSVVFDCTGESFLKYWEFLFFLSDFVYCCCYCCCFGASQPKQGLKLEELSMWS